MEKIEKKVGYVYVITNLLDTNDKYIGSTTQTVQHRYKQHIGHAFDENSPKYNRKLYVQIRTVGKEFFEVSLLENVLYGNILELRKREQYFIDTLKSNLNNYNAVQDQNKYRISGMKSHKKYYENNKVKVLAQQHEYALTHKVQIAEVGKKYRTDNAELKARRAIKCICPDCKTEYTHDHKSRHLRSKFHINSLVI